jgi:hypothetical protein
MKRNLQYFKRDVQKNWQYHLNHYHNVTWEGGMVCGLESSHMQQAASDENSISKVQAMKAVKYSSTMSFTLALDRGVWLMPNPDCFILGKRPRTYCT